ncbi:MAG: tetratricopeptide repeat protein, partial [bacterium]|nr:tetratricopeptide repeat protein [bacterium]
MMDYGTSDENLGRLEKNAENAKNDREKVDALIALAYKLRGAGSQRAGKLIEEAYLLAKSINYEKGIGYSLDAKGLQHIFSAEFETALNTYNEARDIFIKIGNSVGEARVLGHFGVIYRSVGDLERAVQAYLDSLELIEKSADKNEPAAKQTNGWSLFGLAGIHFDLKEFEPALEYYRKSLKLFEKIDFKSGAASAMNGIGITYQAMNQNKRAVGYHFKSLELNRICDFYIGISRSLSDIGTCYENSGDYATALEYNFKSLAIREKAGSRSAIITNLLNIGRIYLETGEFGKATEFLQRALEESKEIDTKPKICSANQLLADLFEKKGDFKNALSYYKSSYAYKEQVFSEESKFKLLNLQTVHKIETAQKEAEIYHLKNIQLSVENDRKSEELERARTLQVSMLPKNDIASSHIEMIGKMRTATEVGGDY